MTEKRLSLTQKGILDALEKYSLALPEEMKKLPLSSMIRLLRKRLHMTQQNLAARAGVPQSFIAKIESGRVKPTLSTLEKVFAALFCDYVIIPIPRKGFDDILQNQALKAAKSRMEYVMGTMSLEEQLPRKKMAADLLKAEEERLLQAGSSDIWEY